MALGVDDRPRHRAGCEVAVEIAIVFGFGCQLALLAFFAAHRWWPTHEWALGRLVYALGIPAALLAMALAIAGTAFPWAFALALYAAWAALGAWLDLIRPIPWRDPPRWSILVPYARLLIAALLAFWIPLWWVDRRLWVAFGVLYAAHMTLNILSHRGGTGSGAVPQP
jgi:hypothetical protein